MRLNQPLPWYQGSIRLFKPGRSVISSSLTLPASVSSNERSEWVVKEVVDQLLELATGCWMLGTGH